jgi:hypothetical protein
VIGDADCSYDEARQSHFVVNINCLAGVGVSPVAPKKQ